MQEYNLSLRTPNKRFQIKQADREERIFRSLEIIWTVRKFFIDNFKVDPPIIDGNQMPLHRKDSASQRNLNLRTALLSKTCLLYLFEFFI